VVDAVWSEGVLTSTVRLAGSVLCRQQVPLPPEVSSVWHALKLPGLVGGERMADVGRRLAAALLDEASQQLIAGLLDRQPPDTTVELALIAHGPALSLPMELIRLAAGEGREVGPLGLLPSVSIVRRPAEPGMVPSRDLVPGVMPKALPGPLKVLAAVAAPDETKTPNAPLDTEAEMAAILDTVAAIADVSANVRPQVRILEVASLAAIRQAVTDDAFHVLHLSAHQRKGLCVKRCGEAFEVFPGRL